MQITTNFEGARSVQKDIEKEVLFLLFNHISGRIALGLIRKNMRSILNIQR